MDQKMMDAMSLEGGDGYYQDNAEAPIQVPDRSGQMVEMDPTALAAEGMAYSAQHMAPNGPLRPMHSLEDQERGLDENKMTKSQLEEQVKNEKEGYPSNLDEAAKVKELEGKVANIEGGINQILSHLSGQSSPASVPQNALTGGSPVYPAENQTAMMGLSETASPPSPPSTGSAESSEPENKPPLLRQVTLRDGRKVSVPQTSTPAMNLGPATETVQPPTQVEEGEQSDDDWNDDPIAAVSEPEEEPKVDQKLEQVANLVVEVNQFMQANDVHRFWRRHLGKSVHRHAGYSGWPQKLQAEFDVRFKGFLSDPQFVSSVCRKVIDMEMGYALGAKWVASLLVATAGHTAFALWGRDG